MTIADLESIKKEIRSTGGVLLGLDMEDRWGAKDEESAKARERDFQLYDQKIAGLRNKLAGMVKQLRTENKALLEQWADAHITLLNDFIARKQTDPEKYRTELYVAREEIGKWTAFRKGEINDVDQNFFYVHYEPTLFRKLFGIEV